MRTGLRVVLLATAAAALGLPRAAAAVEVHVQQLTDFSARHNLAGVGGGRLAFTREVIFGPFYLGTPDLFVWDGERVTQITDDPLESPISDARADFFGARPVWSRGVGQAGQEIVLLGDGEIVPLTANGHPDDASFEGASERLVAWRARPDTIEPEGEEIFVFDGAQVLRLTTNDYPDRFVVASGGRVAWLGFPPDDGVVADGEIFLWDGHGIRQLTDDDLEQSNPRISGDRVVWTGFDGNDWEIFQYDGDSIQPITENDYDDLSPEMAGRRVVWVGSPGDGPGDIFLSDDGVVSRLTETEEHDLAPELSGSAVVWMNRRGERGTHSYFVSTRIMVYDGREVRPVPETEDRRTEVSLRFVSESSFAWLVDPEYPLEDIPSTALFVATLVPEQVTLLDDGRWRVVGELDAAAHQILVSVDGAPAGAFAALRFLYASDDLGFDEVLVLRGDGRIEPALPGGVPGASASLGSYWDCERGLVGPLRFVSLELPDHSRKSGQLDLRGQLSNLDSLESEKFRLRIRAPKPERLRVEFRYRLLTTRELCVDPDRRDTQEAFRVAQLEANYLGPDAHTNDLTRYVKDLRLDCDLFDCDVDRVTFCAPLVNETGYVIERPRRLEGRVLSLFHTSDAPEPTPTLELELRAPHPHNLRPQGFVTEGSDPDEGNVAFWADWPEVHGRYGPRRKLASFNFALEAEPPHRPDCDRFQD